MKTSNYNIRLDPDIKAKAENTFAVYGLTLSDAINVFLHKSILEYGFPFDLREPKPTAELLRAMEETEQIAKEYADGTRKAEPFTNARDMIMEILSEEGGDDV